MSDSKRVLVVGGTHGNERTGVQLVRRFRANPAELERESFMRLLGEKKTHERIEAMLKTGKPLRN